MKSIIEEASSVIKAIEKGWIQAGKPQEFSVKVFQEAERNFIGMTTKSAKIAIIFETTPTKSIDSVEKKPFKQKSVPVVAPAKQEQPSRPAPELKKVHKEVPEISAKASVKPSTPKEALPEDSKKDEAFWSEQMINEAIEWLKGALTLLGKPDTPFTLDQKRYYLKINFNKALFEDPEKEKTIFRSFSYLVMQVLRNKFKRNFRGFKLILTSETP